MRELHNVYWLLSSTVCCLYIFQEKAYEFLIIEFMFIKTNLCHCSVVALKLVSYLAYHAKYT